MANDGKDKTDRILDAPSSRRKGVTRADVECFGISLVLVLYSLGILHSVFGLIFVTPLIVASALVFFLVFAAAFVLFVGMLSRLFGLCAARTLREKRFGLHMLAGVAALAFFVGSFLFSIGPTPGLMLLRGFKTNMQLRADVPAIRAWLTTLDPNDYAEERYDLYSEQEHVPRSQWPKPVAALGPRGVFFFLDERGHPAVRLSWGGLLGHCGLVVGHEEMRMPRPDPLAGDAHNLEFGRGAYVWCIL